MSIAAIKVGYLVVFARPFSDEGTTQGSDGDKFSAAHWRAKRLSSAAVYKLSLCLIFSQCVSMVLRLRWNCSAISADYMRRPTIETPASRGPTNAQFQHVREAGFSRKVRCTTAAATRSLKYNSPARTLRTARSTSAVVFSFMM